jgi:hypothetical protein
MERCFLLATHLQLVADALQMDTVSGRGLRSEGFVGGDDLIHWRGRRLGFQQTHVSRITCFEPPTFFQDTMERGRFRRFEHDHHFSQVGDHTLMIDYVRFSLPLGLVGRLAGKQIVLPHVVKLVRGRLQMLKRIAESEAWREYLPAEPAAAAGVGQ